MFCHEDHEVFRVGPVFPDEIDNPLGILQRDLKA